MPANRACGGCAIALLVVASAVGAQIYLFVFGIDHQVRRVEAVGKWTGVRFTAGSKLLMGKSHEGTESYLTAELTIPRRSAKQFLSQLSQLHLDEEVICGHKGAAIVHVDRAADALARVKVEWNHL